MGAWIETECSQEFDLRRQKLLPLWEHGLKHPFRYQLTRGALLLPLWEHGLKLNGGGCGLGVGTGCSLYGSMD